MKKGLILSGFLCGTLLSMFLCHMSIGSAPKDCEACECGCNEGFPCQCDHVATKAEPCCCSPDRKTPDPKEDKTVPQIGGPSNYGDISQDQRDIAIDGHPNWYAGKGQIRSDGKLTVNWVERATGREAIGLYDLSDGGIIGHWAWVGEGFISQEDGSLLGAKSSEILRAKKTMPPPMIDF